MIRKFLTGVPLLILPALAQADFIGIHVGGGAWNGSFSGDIISDVSLDGDLNIQGDTGSYIYAAFEHPVPLIPNIKIARTTMEDSATGSLSSNFEFNGTNYVVNETVMTARYFNGDVGLNGNREAIDVVLPMLYARAKIGLPFTGTYIGGEGNIVSYSGNELADLAVHVGWETENFIFPEFGVQLGYRRFSLDVSEEDADVAIDARVDGVFVNLTAHF
jgi:outer membrane protein